MFLTTDSIFVTTYMADSILVTTYVYKSHLIFFTKHGTNKNAHIYTPTSMNILIFRG